MPVTVGVVVFTSLYGKTPNLFVDPRASVVGPFSLLFRMARFGGDIVGSQTEQGSPEISQYPGCGGGVVGRGVDLGGTAVVFGGG